VSSRAQDRLRKRMRAAPLPRHLPWMAPTALGSPKRPLTLVPVSFRRLSKRQIGPHRCALPPVFVAGFKSRMVAGIVAA